MKYRNSGYNPNTPELMNIALREEEPVRKYNYGDEERYEKLAKHFKGGNFIDVGCLNSPLSVMMKKKFPESNVYSLDHADEVVAHFQKKSPEVNYVCSDCYKMPFEDNFFDYVVAGELLEHLDNPERFIDEAKRILKPGGWFALSTPNEERYREQGGLMHVNMFTITEMEFILLRKKFKNIRVIPYNVLHVKMMLAWAQK